ncbi:MAG: hypothetical protein ACK57R_04750 [Dolichospermum sp.]|uniref:Uncharacterized protein n=1 Tax=Dolichospermum circinale CS-537/01 TaxID=3021739 RepID=A0ABT5A7U8_9CYAN|nr:hypothetical protein [Dolichospermum circinale]MCE2721245.1 hypothetical protein [Anabaena sp. 49628_E55]MDB9488034.1 hypothetical protein [Dolichospermum circinale CS-537/01]
MSPYELWILDINRLIVAYHYPISVSSTVTKKGTGNREQGTDKKHSFAPV